VQYWILYYHDEKQDLKTPTKNPEQRAILVPHGGEFFYLCKLNTAEVEKFISKCGVDNHIIFDNCNVNEHLFSLVIGDDKLEFWKQTYRPSLEDTHTAKFYETIEIYSMKFEFMLDTKAAGKLKDILSLNKKINYFTLYYYDKRIDIPGSDTCNAAILVPHNCEFFLVCRSSDHNIRRILSTLDSPIVFNEDQIDTSRDPFKIKIYGSEELSFLKSIQNI